MKSKGLKIHSTVDLITNSSTTIYTYQDCSISSAKELLGEMLKVFGVDKNVDDIFVVTAFAKYDDDYFDCCDEDLSDKDISKLIEDIKTGEKQKPEWMVDIEGRTDYSGYHPPMRLYIYAKESEYNGIANKLIEFLNSPNFEAFYDG